MLELQDQKLDYQAKLERKEGTELTLKNEINKLMDTIGGKDMAISQLSEQMVQSHKEISRY